MKINEQLLAHCLRLLSRLMPSFRYGFAAMPGFDRDEVNELIANARKELRTETN